MEYAFAWEPKGAIVTFNGDFSMYDINTANEVLNGDERYYEHAWSIWNFTNCRAPGIKPQAPSKLVAINLGASHTLTDFKQAFVVNDTNFHELCQAYIDKSIYAGSPWKFKIFTTLDEAKKWCKTS